MEVSGLENSDVDHILHILQEKLTYKSDRIRVRQEVVFTDGSDASINDHV